MLLLLACAVMVVLVQGCRAFGASARGARKFRMEQSPEWSGGRFVNPQPLYNDAWGSLHALTHVSPAASPKPGSLPRFRGDPAIFAVPPPSGLRVSWLGHSTTLLEIDGHRFLTDPMFSERASPLTWAGPRRWYPPPLDLSELPDVEAVVVSHDHYDHLDFQTVVALNARGIRFIVPLGVGAHLQAWGVPASRITELDWWQHAFLGNLDVVCTPARHASGRTGLDFDAKLWAGFAFLGPKHRVYFSGDSGLFPALADIGARLGPFDLTMVEVGQYDRAWPDWHMGPEQAVRAHQMVRGKVFLPIHWGLFQLAAHGWTEPIERALAASTLAHVTILTPRPGQSVEPEAPPPFERWWPELPWQTAAQAPIVSTQLRSGP